MLLAHVVKGEIELVSDLVAHDPANADPAGLGERFQARRDIHTVAEDVVFLSDHVAKIDADPKLGALVVWDFRFAVNHSALDLHSAAHGVHNTRKLRQEAIASVLHNPAAVLPDLRIDQFPEVCLEAFVRTFLVRPHQARIARHIGREDRREPAGLAHDASPIARRRPVRNSSRCSAFRK